MAGRRKEAGEGIYACCNPVGMCLTWLDKTSVEIRHVVGLATQWGEASRSASQLI